MPRNLGNSSLKRMLFVIHLLKALENNNFIVIVQDEAGFGGYSSHLRKYGYSLKGEPLIHKE